MQHIRFDFVRIPKVEKTAEGYIRGEVTPTRVGVFKYRNTDGTIRRELRHPDDILKKDSLDTLKMIPITNDHPPEFVNARNADKYQVGLTGENYLVTDQVIALPINITHKDAIAAVENGKQELSLGYIVELKPEKGNYDGEDYDFRQINPRYNHLAIVDRGRAGREARLRFDNAYEEITEHDQSNKKGSKMSEDLQLKLDAAIAQQTAKDKEIELLNDRIKQSQLKVDSLEKSNTKLTNELNTEKSKRTDEVIATMVIERVNLLARSADVLEIDGFIHHADRDIMIAAINAKQKTDETFKDVDDAYIKGRFDALLGAQSKSKVDHSVFKVLQRKHNDAVNPSAGSHYFNMLSEARTNIAK